MVLRVHGTNQVCTSRGHIHKRFMLCVLGPNGGIFHCGAHSARLDVVCYPDPVVKYSSQRLMAEVKRWIAYSRTDYNHKK